MDGKYLTPAKMARTCLFGLLMATSSLVAAADTLALPARELSSPASPAQASNTTVATQAVGLLTPAEASYLSAEASTKPLAARQFYGYNLRQSGSGSYSGVLLLLLAAMLGFMWIRTKSLNTK
jgi:hypothetical protein